MMAVATVSVMFGLIFVGFDITFAMIAAALVYFTVGGFFGAAADPRIIPQLMSDGVRQEILLAVPLFILTGALMGSSGITLRLMAIFYRLLSRVRGPLGYVNVGASLLMSGMSGSAVADAAATSSVLIDPMVRTGYTREDAGAITAASATVGPVIPPSIPFVLIGGLTTVSIGQLFVAGVLPGFVMAAAVLVMVFISNRHRPVVRGTSQLTTTEPVTWVLSTLQLLAALAVPVVVVGGIVFGVTTATEAGAVGAAVALVAWVTVFRRRDAHELYVLFRNTAVTSGAILITLASSAVIGWILAIEQTGVWLGDIMMGLTGQPMLLWLVIVAAFIVLGLVVEPIAVILIVSPIIYPQLGDLGIDPLHFSIVMTVTLMIGLITPPVGLNLFTVSRVGNVPLNRLTRASLPYVFVLVVAALLCAAFPQLTLWLPGAVYGQ